MKFGFRIPSLKRRISARTSWRRYVRHSMGIKVPKGIGIFTNPKKAIYNKVYRKTTFGIGDMLKLFKFTKSKPKEQFQIAPMLGFMTNNSVLDKHFELSEGIPFYYRQREKEGMLDKAAEACKQQIELAPKAVAAFLKKYPWQALPSHRGYEQLVIILDKKGKRREAREAIVLCEQAKEQGWAGNWDKRIHRINIKLNKS